MPSNSSDIDFLVGTPEADLLTMRASVLSSLVSEGGNYVQSVATRDLSTTFGSDIRQQDMLRAINYALWKCDPTTYPAPESSKVHRFYTV